MKTVLGWVVVGVVLGLATAGSAVTIDTVPVGDPGNVGEGSGESYGGYGPNRICGAVDYAYRIGKYEVTAGQYCEFLNAVADTDAYGLYNTNMWSSSSGCKIERTGNSPNYQYSVASDWANRPVNYVSYWDSCRFANWLHNGQPSGAQGAGTTERGAYTLDGYNGIDGRTIQRNPGWNWAVTSEDEWYKAAYYKGGGANAGYFDYPTNSDTAPSNVLGNPTDPGNNATYYNNGYTIGSPYYRTEVGAHENSDSPYGTFDQGGNVWEWNESVVYEGSDYSYRGLRGGSFIDNGGSLHASVRVDSFDPAIEGYTVGFRVSEVPEPGSMAVLALGGIGMVVRRRGLGR